MKKTVHQLAHEIRLSFPNAYQGLSDEALVEIWLSTNPHLISNLDFGNPVPDNLKQFAEKQQSVPYFQNPAPPQQFNPNAARQASEPTAQNPNPHYQTADAQYQNLSHGANTYPPPPYPNPQFPHPQGQFPHHLYAGQYEARNPLWKRVLKTIVVLFLIWLFLLVAANVYEEFSR